VLNGYDILASVLGSVHYSFASSRRHIFHCSSCAQCSLLLLLMMMTDDVASQKKNPGEIMIPDKSSLLMSEVKHNVSRVADIFYFRSSARATKGTMWSLIISQACAMMVAILTLTVGA
jgi:hypothetical protein